MAEEQREPLLQNFTSTLSHAAAVVGSTVTAGMTLPGLLVFRNVLLRSHLVASGETPIGGGQHKGTWHKLWHGKHSTHGHNHTHDHASDGTLLDEPEQRLERQEISGQGNALQMKKMTESEDLVNLKGEEHGQLHLGLTIDNVPRDQHLSSSPAWNGRSRERSDR